MNSLENQVMEVGHKDNARLVSESVALARVVDPVKRRMDSWRVPVEVCIVRDSPACGSLCLFPECRMR